VQWLDKEVFLAPPQGEKRQLDLVAQLRLREDAPAAWEGRTDLVTLVHIEVESRESAAALRPRMLEYYIQLRRDTGLPVLPIGLFLRVGLDGVGWDAYEESFWEHRILRFEYAYVGLPALDSETFATGENLIGAALSSLMKVTPSRKAELTAEALKRIAVADENDFRRYLLAECLEAYANLDASQQAKVQELLGDPSLEVKPLMITTFERIKLAERLETVLLQLETKFGPLAPSVKEKVESMPPGDLRQLSVNLLTANTLQDLQLTD
jgi:hypothetical protein